MNEIRNIYCVGRNYVEHAHELNNQVPTSPLLFSKPTHSLVKANGEEITLPSDRGAVHYEAELVIRIGQPYKKGMKVDELVDRMALGIDFTLREVQSELKKKGHPWLLAKGFPNSAVLSEFIDFPGVEECKKSNFSLMLNGEQVQLGTIQHLIFDLQTLIDYTALHLGLGEGDVIFTGTPQGVGKVSDGDELSLLWDAGKLGDCTIKLT
ncbi:fumarylacetoacetate hydrolase family protein [Halobacillus amylolyticus]|uniref:Fumarylacetoacetate hydrolase family protein n=1 Tax=Halobacillus amylolyticus TaxID=2932259 RepID=A0ABY4HJB1_9BACI|nr:fumarylacetoacetate hydrolase family protein [Halobacillus amylolyticus]UOR13565.1 fumarylacetoacetate hydrolase family protein [Halobacillus amylolyticus]